VKTELVGSNFFEINQRAGKTFFLERQLR